MFDISWSEMLLIVGVAVVVIGPQDLPRAMCTAGKFVRKIKMFTGDIQKSLDRIIHEEELNDITRDANRAGGDNLQFEIDRQYRAEQDRIEQARKAAVIAAAAELAESEDEGDGHAPSAGPGSAMEMMPLAHASADQSLEKKKTDV